jgi:SET domain-containing protein
MLIDPSALHEFTEVRASLLPGAGLGLFATKLIRGGTVWWKARKDNVIRVSRQQYELLLKSHLQHSELSQQLVRAMQVFGYINGATDEVVIAIDDGRFVNHSANPNSIAALDDPNEGAMAARDIAPGEEITEDYRSYSSSTWALPEQPFLIKP